MGNQFQTTTMAPLDWFCFTYYKKKMSDISELNECLSDPCENGGTCEDGINVHTCVCAPGYKGTQCEIGNVSWKCHCSVWDQM